MKKMMFTTEMLCALLVMVLARSTSSLLVHCYDEEGIFPKKNFWCQLGVRNEVLVNQFRLLQKNFFRADSKVHASFLGKMALKIPMPERKKKKNLPSSF